MMEPRPYNLDDPTEIARLYREVVGYLRACERQHHGTDSMGRAYAYDALVTLGTRHNEKISK